MSLADDQTIVAAVSNLPSLALPPIGGLLVLLFGYIVLVGPVNYLVLRRLDRREWAWFTVPALIVVFTVGVVRDRRPAARHGRHRPRGRDRPRRPGHRRGGRAVLPRHLQPDARRRTSSACPGDALLSAPMNGDFFGGGTGADARRAPGRPVARPRPRRRVRLAADDPRRGERHRSQRRPRTCGSPTATSRGPSRNHSDRTLESAGARARRRRVRLTDIAAGSYRRRGPAGQRRPVQRHPALRAHRRPANFDGEPR